MKAIQFCVSFSFIFAIVSCTVTECEKNYLTLVINNTNVLFNQSNYSGKFLNDLGEYEQCQSNQDSKYILGRYTIMNSNSTKHIWKSFNNYVIGLCVPVGCTASDGATIDNYYTNISKTFLTENYFNYTKNVSDVTQSYVDVNAAADKTSDEKSSTSSVMIVVFVFLCLLGIMGLVVEKTNLGNKPNLKKEEEEQEENYWDKFYGQDGFEVEEDKGEKMDDEYQRYCKDEGKLIMSKTLWGIILLSFSFGRNSKRLFQFSVIKRKHVKSTLIEGAKVISLFWVMAGNTFLFSFYSYPANFENKKDISQNYFFMTIFNNEFAFDSLLFLIALFTGYELIEKVDMFVTSTCSFILHIFNFIIKMLFPILMIVGIASIYPLLSSGPLWSSIANQVTDTCPDVQFAHILFISNLYPYQNNIGESCCLPWLWFVSTEFQFFFICLGLTILYKKNCLAASICTSSICVGSIVISAFVASFGGTTTLPQYDDVSYAEFTKPWSRIFGYSLGLFVGFIMYEFSKELKQDQKRRFGWQIISWMENMNINRRTIFIIFAFIMIAFPSIFQWVFLSGDSLSPFNITSKEKTFYIIYITVCKPIYFFGFIVIIIFCLLNKLKWITTVLGNYVWGPLSELSYSAYMIHYFVIIYYYGSLLQTLYISIPDMVFTSLAVGFLSIATAIPFAFLIEIPSRNLMELILFTMRRYRNEDESLENDAKNTTSDGKNTGSKENDISTASANLIFLSGMMASRKESNKKKKNDRIDADLDSKIKMD